MSGESALLIIDVQTAFFIRELGVLVYSSDEYLARIRDLIARARKADVPVIFIQHDGKKGSPWEPGTKGWTIHLDISPKAGELVVNKPTPDAFYKTTLQKELDSMGIKKLIVAGIQSDLCVDTTVRRAYSLEYDVTVVEDAHTTFDTPLLRAPQIIAHHNSIFAGRFARLVKTVDIDFEKLKF
jgi:nicotinamidase-related amidase